jgi:hypothetical protein
MYSCIIKYLLCFIHIVFVASWVLGFILTGKIPSANMKGSVRLSEIYVQNILTDYKLRQTTKKKGNNREWQKTEYISLYYRKYTECDCFVGCDKV